MRIPCVKIQWARASQIEPASRFNMKDQSWFILLLEEPDQLEDALNGPAEWKGSTEWTHTAVLRNTNIKYTAPGWLTH